MDVWHENTKDQETFLGPCEERTCPRRSACYSALDCHWFRGQPDIPPQPLLANPSSILHLAHAADLTLCFIHHTQLSSIGTRMGIPVMSFAWPLRSSERKAPVLGLCCCYPEVSMSFSVGASEARGWPSLSITLQVRRCLSAPVRLETAYGEALLGYLAATRSHLLPDSRQQPGRWAFETLGEQGLWASLRGGPVI
ncbi:hypothetical protein FQN60_002255 [Etheostoma spectabile]|uniref:Uncharacterized protein n=1 Tax=Etheostoma spectabile TaxID=54343 RepID=A0A5J5D9G3_9PERO|nr:hypothetical protein FQN60_002255 [Etheostoma spectabile]